MERLEQAQVLRVQHLLALGHIAVARPGHDPGLVQLALHAVEQIVSHKLAHLLLEAHVETHELAAGKVFTHVLFKEAYKLVNLAFRAARAELEEDLLLHERAQIHELFQVGHVHSVRHCAGEQAGVGPACHVRHVGATAHAAHHLARCLKQLQGLAYQRSAHAKSPRKLALGRQAIARPVDRIGHKLVQACQHLLEDILAFDGMEGGNLAVAHVNST